MVTPRNRSFIAGVANRPNREQRRRSLFDHDSCRTSGLGAHEIHWAQSRTRTQSEANVTCFIGYLSESRRKSRMRRGEKRARGGVAIGFAHPPRLGDLVDERGYRSTLGLLKYGLAGRAIMTTA